MIEEIGEQSDELDDYAKRAAQAEDIEQYLRIIAEYVGLPE